MKNKAKILRFFWVFPLILCSCHRDTRTNAEQYADQLKECRANQDFHTQLLIYPESLNGEIVKYFYMEQDSVFAFTNDYFFYLVLSFDTETFNSELLRISNVKTIFPKFNNAQKQVLHFEEQSMYLAISRDNRYEYALYNKEKLEIAYISNQLFTWEDAKVEPEHKMPEVTIPSDKDDGENTYNMYYYYDLTGVGWEMSD